MTHDTDLPPIEWGLDALETDSVGENHKEGIGAGDGIRTRDIDLGKVALYQLSYSRTQGNPILAQKQYTCQTLLKSH
jgi:hypothetical protein